MVLLEENAHGNASSARGCRLVGLLEANALEGGLLQSMTLLKETPADGKGVTSLITTIPPCYCSQAVDYGAPFNPLHAATHSWRRSPPPPHPTLHAVHGRSVAQVDRLQEVARQCLRTLHCLHQQEVIHCDLVRHAPTQTPAFRPLICLPCRSNAETGEYPDLLAHGLQG